jgi:energy-coupling factor transporter ATP-binding protein EcfA2
MDPFNKEFDSYSSDGSFFDDDDDDTLYDDKPSPSSTIHKPCVLCKNANIKTLFCAICNNSFCDACWSQWLLHQEGQVGLNGRPHEPSDLEVINRLKETFNPPSDQPTQRDRHEEDQETTWFSVERNEGELPELCGHGRYAVLMASGPVGGFARHPQLVSFIGQTGAGKSTLIKILIEKNVGLGNSGAAVQAACSTPIPGSVKNDNTPTSGDVHLYADPATFFEPTPMLYADCEGLEGGEATPVSVAVRAGTPIEDRVPGRKRLKKRNKQYARAFATRDKIRHQLDWAAGDPERQKREFAVAELYPRLLYTFSDVIVFVLQNAK